MKKTTVVIVPGYGDSDTQHWQSRWERQIPNPVRVIQEDWNRPRCEEWVENLDQIVQKTKGPLILVGHSLGCLTIVEWAHKKRTHCSKIQGALLVAPPDPKGKSFLALDIQGFQAPPLEKLPFRSIVVASSNDPFTSLKIAENFAKTWGSEFVNVGNKGHMGSDVQLGEWEEGKQLLDRLL